MMLPAIPVKRPPGLDVIWFLSRKRFLVERKYMYDGKEREGGGGGGRG